MHDRHGYGHAIHGEGAQSTRQLSTSSRPQSPAGQRPNRHPAEYISCFSFYPFICPEKGRGETDRGDFVQRTVEGSLLPDPVPIVGCVPESLYIDRGISGHHPSQIFIFSHDIHLIVSRSGSGPLICRGQGQYRATAFSRSMQNTRSYRAAC